MPWNWLGGNGYGLVFDCKSPQCNRRYRRVSKLTATDEVDAVLTDQPHIGARHRIDSKCNGVITPRSIRRSLDQAIREIRSLRLLRAVSAPDCPVWYDAPEHWYRRRSFCFAALRRDCGIHCLDRHRQVWLTEQAFQRRHRVCRRHDCKLPWIDFDKLYPVSGLQPKNWAYRSWQSDLAF